MISLNDFTLAFCGFLSKKTEKTVLGDLIQTKNEGAYVVKCTEEEMKLTAGGAPIEKIGRAHV